MSFDPSSLSSAATAAPYTLSHRHLQSKPSTNSSSLASNSPSTFEFTKRKRWADLLIHELSEAIIFVLSNDAKIWFCGRAVTELLGWRDAELIDCNICDFVNTEDLHAFRNAFEDSLRTRTEMNSYVRLKTRNDHPPPNAPQAEILFEIKGYPHYIENESTARCFFAVAKPYPSRNVAMLNTFLELKIENERLQQRLAELRVRAPSPGPPSEAIYTLGSSFTTRSIAPSVAPRPLDTPGSYYTPNQRKVSYDDIQGNQMRGGYESVSVQQFRVSGPLPPDDDAGEDVARRKKLRKLHMTELYVCVTCGRTDSPEWRKGPQGPKTLCNACGLRWAKEVRNKADENNTAAGSGAITA
ncbi:white collar 2 type of transcription factor [Phlebopus sp. FC_14]|nr:white collar 2 type of transcription factor [Phlebopus sp. FC_14]